MPERQELVVVVAGKGRMYQGHSFPFLLHFALSTGRGVSLVQNPTSRPPSQILPKTSSARFTTVIPPSSCRSNNLLAPLSFPNIYLLYVFWSLSTVIISSLWLNCSKRCFQCLSKGHCCVHTEAYCTTGSLCNKTGTHSRHSILTFMAASDGPMYRTHLNFKIPKHFWADF